MKDKAETGGTALLVSLLCLLSAGLGVHTLEAKPGEPTPTTKAQMLPTPPPLPAQAKPPQHMAAHDKISAGLQDAAKPRLENKWSLGEKRPAVSTKIPATSVRPGPRQP